MQDCRFGSLTQDTYCLLHGTPTYVPAKEGCSQCGHDIVEDPVLGRYKQSWADVFLKGADMSKHIEGSECATFRDTRTLRQRVLSLDTVSHSASDQASVPAEVRQPPFTDHQLFTLSTCHDISIFSCVPGNSLEKATLCGAMPLIYRYIQVIAICQKQRCGAN